MLYIYFRGSLGFSLYLIVLGWIDILLLCFWIPDFFITRTFILFWKWLWWIELNERNGDSYRHAQHVWGWDIVIVIVVCWFVFPIWDSKSVRTNVVIMLIMVFQWDVLYFFYSKGKSGIDCIDVFDFHS